MNYLYEIIYLVNFIFLFFEMSNPPHIRCSLCWESECKHWCRSQEAKTTTVVKKKIFGQDEQQVQTTWEYSVMCTTCSSTSQLDLGVEIRCLCSDGRFVKVTKDAPAKDATMIFLCGGLYIRSKCIHCKTTGNTTIKTYGPCINCQGFGGIPCTRCHFSGNTLLYAQSYNSGDYNDGCTLKKMSTGVCQGIF